STGRPRSETPPSRSDRANRRRQSPGVRSTRRLTSPVRRGARPDPWPTLTDSSAGAAASPVSARTSGTTRPPCGPTPSRPSPTGAIGVRATVAPACVSRRNVPIFRALPGPGSFPSPPGWVMVGQALRNRSPLTGGGGMVAGGGGRGAEPGTRRRVMSFRRIEICLLTAACAGLVGASAWAADEQKPAAAPPPAAVAGPAAAAPGAPCPPAPQLCTVKCIEWVPETVPVTRTVYRQEQRQETYTCYRTVTVPETRTRQVTVMRPVTETVMETRQVTCTRPVCETVMETRTVTERVPVTKTVTCMETRWETQQVTEMRSRTVRNVCYVPVEVPCGPLHGGGHGGGLLGGLCHRNRGCGNPCADACNPCGNPCGETCNACPPTRTVCKKVVTCQTVCEPVTVCKKVKVCVPVTKQVCCYECVSRCVQVPV